MFLAIALTLSARPLITVDMDTSKAPDLAPWAKGEAKLMVKWYPKITKILGAPAPRITVHVVFDPAYNGVAATGGHDITVSPTYLRAHMDDKGFLIHELVHVVQGYPQYHPVWLVEGIADYVRFGFYEPKTYLYPPKPTSSYTNSYRVTARFLIWLKNRYGVKYIAHISQALKADTYTPAIWSDKTNESLDQLWSDYEAHPSIGQKPPMPKM